MFMLTDKGYRDLKSAIAACTLTAFAQFLPFAVVIQLFMVLLGSLSSGAVGSAGTPIEPQTLILLFVEGLAAAVLVFIASKNDYRKTYTATYLEAESARIRIAEHLRRLPMSVFNSKDLTELTTSVMGDVAIGEHVLSHVVPQVAANAISSTVVCALLAFFDWRLALAVYCTLPISLIIIVISRRVQTVLSKRHVDAKLKASAEVQEYLEGLEVIKACNLEGERSRTLDRALRTMKRLSIQTEFGVGVFVTGAQAVLQLGTGITVLVGAQLISTGRIELLPLLIFMLVTTRIYGPILVELTLLPELFHNIIATARTRRLMSLPVMNGSETVMPDGLDIVLEDVSFGYQSYKGKKNESSLAIKDVSLSIPAGSVTAFVGPSGSGKSTIARLIARFWDVQQGRITLGGVDVRDFDPEHLMEFMSFVFQDVVLFDDTVMGNIRVGRRGASDDEVRRAARAARCDEFIKALPQGYDTMLGENGATLSGGERQRLSIARALLKDAPIILLDEATASLDPENETAIQQALSALITNKTVIVIAHRLRTVLGANNIIVLDNGRVVEQGSGSELLATDGLFAQLYRTQQQSLAWSV
jgi:ATP-binding cassette subfamily B protein